MRFSVSEMQQFLRCRRQWNLISQNRQGLVKLGGPAIALQIGSSFHAGVAATADGEDPMETTKKHIQEEHKKIKDDYRTMVGVPMGPEETDVLEQSAGTAYTLVKKYFEYYGDNPIDPWQYIRSETTFEIPIPNSEHTLIGTMDGLAKDTHGRTWIIEHKTFSQATNLDKLETDMQLMVYCWAAQMLFGDPVAGALYDGVSKKISPLDDDDKLAKKLIRHQITFSQAALLNAQTMITDIANEMGKVDVGIFPNFRWEGCWDCSVRPLCKAMQLGDDVEWIIQNEYRRGDGHATVKRMSRPRFEVTSINDL